MEARFRLFDDNRFVDSQRQHDVAHLGAQADASAARQTWQRAAHRPHFPRLFHRKCADRLAQRLHTETAVSRRSIGRRRRIGRRRHFKIARRRHRHVYCRPKLPWTSRARRAVRYAHRPGRINAIERLRTSRRRFSSRFSHRRRRGAARFSAPHANERSIRPSASSVAEASCTRVLQLLDIAALRLALVEREIRLVDGTSVRTNVAVDLERFKRFWLRSTFIECLNIDVVRATRSHRVIPRNGSIANIFLLLIF